MKILDGDADDADDGGDDDGDDDDDDDDDGDADDDADDDGDGDDDGGDDGCDGDDGGDDDGGERNNAEDRPRCFLPSNFERMAQPLSSRAETLALSNAESDDGHASETLATLSQSTTVR